MPQRPKPEMRAAIVAAASALFASVGYEATTMAEVATRAGTSIGNVYKYFSNKEALFAEVLPRAFTSDLRRLTKKRVESLGKTKNVDELSPADPYHVVSGELLEHCIAHRERVVILLSKAEGTPFASFASELAKGLVTWALAYVAKAYPKIEVDEVLRFALRRIYDAFIESMACIFAAFHDEKRIHEAAELVTAHHLGGLKRLFEVA